MWGVKKGSPGCPRVLASAVGTALSRGKGLVALRGGLIIALGPWCMGAGCVGLGLRTWAVGTCACMCPQSAGAGAQPDPVLTALAPSPLLLPAFLTPPAGWPGGVGRWRFSAKPAPLIPAVPIPAVPPQGAGQRERKHRNGGAMAGP